MPASRKLASALLLTLSLLLLPVTGYAVTKGSKAKAALNRAELKEAEARLAEMGYGSGRSALITFQKWEGRKITGRLNREEADAILNASARVPQPLTRLQTQLVQCQISTG